MHNNTNQNNEELESTISKDETIFSSNIFKYFIPSLIWIYIIVKLFIFDIDIYLVSKLLPEYYWIIKYKYFIIISFVSISLIFFKKIKLIYIVYLIFFPVIIIFFKIPYIIFKNKMWNLAIFLIISLRSYFKSFKYNFIIFSFYVTSFFSIIISSNKIVLYCSSIIILLILFIIIANNFVLIFKPSRQFELYHKFINFFNFHNHDSLKLDEDMKNLDITKMDDKQQEKWMNNLQILVIFNRFALFTAKKFRHYQSNGRNLIYYLTVFISLTFITILTFTSINYSLYKINMNNFSFTEPPSFFTFFYYSFNKMFYSQIPEIIPAMRFSQLASMVQMFFALVLIVVLFSLLITFRNKQIDNEFDKIISKLNNLGGELEDFIKDEYSFNSIDDAIKELEKLKSAFIKFIFSISEKI